jgi:ADP-L-glycero-D-manno-heptose 6-epimerase
MIIVTGGAGFIGSCIVKELNNNKINDIIIVDELGSSEKWKNLVSLKYADFIHKDKFLAELKSMKNVDLIIHMGACASTTEKNAEYLMENNFKYSKELYDWCQNNDSRLIYASSAATYGDGTLGYDDSKTDELLPLNMYGYTKKLFDQYVLSSKELRQCVGLRFFNVYGPNEYHKDNMASVIFHSFNQIKKEKKVRLFKSYKQDFKDGEQMRDFVYVKDVVSVVMFMLNNPDVNGIFNVGTGKARSYNDLAVSVFKSLNLKNNVEYIDMPQGLKEKYQYFTEADIRKLRKLGYKKEFYSLEMGINDYVCNYLGKGLAHY